MHKERKRYGHVPKAFDISAVYTRRQARLSAHTPRPNLEVARERTHEEDEAEVHPEARNRTDQAEERVDRFQEGIS